MKNDERRTTRCSSAALKLLHSFFILRSSFFILHPKVALMSERHIPTGSEIQPITIEHETHAEHHRNSHEQEQKNAEHRPSVDELAKRVEAHAVSGKELAPSTSHENNHHPVLVNKQLKDTAYNRTMVRVQKHLSAPSRVFSKAVHSTLLDKPSEFASRTVARPSGMLGGTFFAMLGTLGLFWLTRKYGYEYNYLMAIVLFIGGAIMGLTAEAVVKVLRRSDS